VCSFTFNPFFFPQSIRSMLILRHGYRSVHVVKLPYRKRRQGSLYGAVVQQPCNRYTTTYSTRYDTVSRNVQVMGRTNNSITVSLFAFGCVRLTSLLPRLTWSVLSNNAPSALPNVVQLLFHINTATRPLIQICHTTVMHEFSEVLRRYHGASLWKVSLLLPPHRCLPCAQQAF
jgi:hypothetical protein